MEPEETMPAKERPSSRRSSVAWPTRSRASAVVIFSMRWSKLLSSGSLSGRMGILRSKLTGTANLAISAALKSAIFMLSMSLGEVVVEKEPLARPKVTSTSREKVSSLVLRETPELAKRTSLETPRWKVNSAAMLRSRAKLRSSLAAAAKISFISHISL